MNNDSSFSDPPPTNAVLCLLFFILGIAQWYFSLSSLKSLPSVYFISFKAIASFFSVLVTCIYVQSMKILCGAQSWWIHPQFFFLISLMTKVKYLVGNCFHSMDPLIISLTQEQEESLSLVWSSISFLGYYTFHCVFISLLGLL